MEDVIMSIENMCPHLLRVSLSKKNSTMEGYSSESRHSINDEIKDALEKVRIGPFDQFSVLGYMEECVKRIVRGSLKYESFPFYTQLGLIVFGMICAGIAIVELFSFWRGSTGAIFTSMSILCCMVYHTVCDWHEKSIPRWKEVSLDKYTGTLPREIRTLVNSLRQYVPKAKFILHILSISPNKAQILLSIKGNSEFFIEEWKHEDTSHRLYT